MQSAADWMPELKDAPAPNKNAWEMSLFCFIDRINASYSKIKSMTRELSKEWKAVASNYTSLEEYLNELLKTGGLEGF